FSTLAILLIFYRSQVSGQNPPLPGFYLSNHFPSRRFDQLYANLWGPTHQRIENNGITIWLDRNSGCGFKSEKPFRSGYFGASIKLQPGYTAGVITAFYLSNNEAHPGYHDEIDIEFLGTTFGKPYTLQTNVYVRGSGDGRIIGREMKFHLWFDPTQDFHHYAILWTPNQILFLVDDVPVRRYLKRSDATFPQRPMWVYGSIWDASSWATEDGKYKVDYSYQPFVGKFNEFKIWGCTAYSAASCRPISGGLTRQQQVAMQWVTSHSMVYDYCRDNRRDHSLTPEC
ncbi:hypothetical protein M569_12004, partial [Genlisea aurea]